MASKVRTFSHQSGRSPHGRSEGEDTVTSIRNRADVRIQEATSGDTVAIAAVLFEAFVAHRSLYTPAAFAATTPTSHQILARLEEGPVWVACSTDEIVGTVSAILRDGGVYLRSMAVLPTARGFGVGRLLLARAEQFAVLHRAAHLSLSTTPFLTAAIQLYQSVGFVRIAGGPDDLFGTPLLSMIKAIDRPA
jgi:GNAT superfamily N-acetyltransferase